MPGEVDYIGDFILYRGYMKVGWSGLTSAVAWPDRPPEPGSLAIHSDYATRNFHYVCAIMRILIIPCPTSHLGAGEKVYPLGLARLSALVPADAAKQCLNMNLYPNPWP
ncbi:hypothetical protein DSCO28_26840 [Desulfosarcina ovata subsp. sediminis]|uniref:Uncharacterized protein n=1 Tax=Desulfosarcina ovata subsp. sediminis TaxID=885957 RepID=A0A5K7ZIQ8_9BACT|nr:hypothetical protein [Desulfosarcina ovata]BBO82118.1 hypothetical protein DSCO28_26840 [Desulfosarcina ovata subsp. sediminis]